MNDINLKNLVLLYRLGKISDNQFVIIYQKYIKKLQEKSKKYSENTEIIKKEIEKTEIEKEKQEIKVPKVDKKESFIQYWQRINKHNSTLLKLKNNQKNLK